MKFEPLVAESGEQGLEVFAAEWPSLVLLDVKMAGMDGYETARRIRAIRPDEWVPIIFLSASEYDQDLERAIESGGDDYLVKPVSAVVLSAKIRALQRLDHMRRKLLDVSSELTAANQRLETLSHQDGLTGIANRRAFDFLLERQFAEAARQRSPFSVVLCDVDHFKAYNDHYGHCRGRRMPEEGRPAASRHTERQRPARRGGSAARGRAARHRAREFADFASGHVQRRHRDVLARPRQGLARSHRPRRRGAVPREGPWPRPHGRRVIVGDVPPRPAFDFVVFVRIED
jgi:CheY-like chemotaxis protein